MQDGRWESGRKTGVVALRICYRWSLYVFAAALMVSSPVASKEPQLKFDHTHSYSEIAAYMRAVAETYPQLTRLITIGESYEGRDLLVLEITNLSTGESLSKPAYFIDGNVHPAEAAGGEIALNTIRTLIRGYGEDPLITRLVDETAFYIMPILNPDGVELYITTPGTVRASVRPFDEDDDGLVDEDPAEDINGDGYITLMRIPDGRGPLKTSSADPRLMVPREEGRPMDGWNGEWTVYGEGIDNDNDGAINEDGVGGIGLNRNWPEQWQPYPIEYHSGPYPLSEPETKSLADFLLSHANITGLINYHGTGNVTAYPPSNLRFDPLTGDVLEQPYADELIYRKFGEKSVELFSFQGELAPYVVRKIYGATIANPNSAVFGMEVDWTYHRLGIFSWILEAGVYPGASGTFPTNIIGQELERLKWSDTHMEGKLFVNWQPYDHPELGEIEIGGFLDKIYVPEYDSYTSVKLLPGADYERLLAAHTQWHLWLMDQVPRVEITSATVTPIAPDHFSIDVSVRNKGFLPTNVTEQALRTETAKPVRAILYLDGATLLHGRREVILGHLPGNPPAGRSAFTQHAGSNSTAKHVQWLVKVSGAGKSTAVVNVVSEKGGTYSTEIVIER